MVESRAFHGAWIDGNVSLVGESRNQNPQLNGVRFRATTNFACWAEIVGAKLPPTSGKTSVDFGSLLPVDLSRTKVRKGSVRAIGGSMKSLRLTSDLSDLLQFSPARSGSLLYSQCPTIVRSQDSRSNSLLHLKQRLSCQWA
jgi:hypothetical protein